MKKEMSLHEALRVALSEIYAALEERKYSEEDWHATSSGDLIEAARVIDVHMRTVE